MVVAVIAMYFFMIRPQKKQEKEANEMRNSLEVGDEVVTIGGIIGQVVNVKNETVTIITSKDRTKLRFVKSAIKEVTVKANAPAEKAEKAEKKPAAEAPALKEDKKPKEKAKKAKAKKEEAPVEEQATEEAPANEAPEIKEEPATAEEETVSVAETPAEEAVAPEATENSEENK